MLTKNAFGNLINKYKAVLANCRLLNAFGTLALTAGLGLATLGTLTLPSDALAADVTTPQVVEKTETTWATPENITLTNAATGTSGVSIEFGGTSPLAITVNAGHTLTVSSPVGNADKSVLYGIDNTRKGAKVTNKGNVVISAYSENQYAKAYGVSGFAPVTFENNGTMAISAESKNAKAEAYGMHINGGTITFNNNGTINVEATGSDAKAYGVCTPSGTTTLNNMGTINVSATGSNACAYQVYARMGTANIGTWTLKLGETYGEQGTGYHVFGVGYSGTLNFGVDGKGTTLIITNDTADGTLYAVKDLVDTPSLTKVKGYIAEAKSKYDFVQWNIVDENGATYSAATPLWSDQ